jgi:hypothetical protein
MLTNSLRRATRFAISNHWRGLVEPVEAVLNVVNIKHTWKRFI